MCVLQQLLPHAALACSGKEMQTKAEAKPNAKHRGLSDAGPGWISCKYKIETMQSEAFLDTDGTVTYSPERLVALGRDLLPFEVPTDDLVLE